MTQPLHATVVARPSADGWRGVLLVGPSGAGKSDLALRLIALGWRLVADDYAHVWASGGALYACCAPSIAGRIEARGVGILDSGALPLARLVLAVECLNAPPERLPDDRSQTLHGIRMPRLSLDIRPASAAVVLAHAMDRL